MSARNLTLSTLAACLCAAGCQQVEYRIDVHERADGTFDYAEMPDGTVVHDTAAYEAAASRLASEATEADAPVTVRFLYDAKDAAPQTDSRPDEQDAVFLPYGYVFTSGPLRTDHLYVGGCVNGPTNMEYSLRLSRNAAQLFDLQLASYTRNGKRCIGAYENDRGIVNWCLCGNPFTRDQVKNGLYAAALGVGLSAATAWLVAEVGTPIAMGALALVL